MSTFMRFALHPGRYVIRIESLCFGRGLLLPSCEPAHRFSSTLGAEPQRTLLLAEWSEAGPSRTSFLPNRSARSALRYHSSFFSSSIFFVWSRTWYSPTRAFLSRLGALNTSPRGNKNPVLQLLVSTGADAAHASVEVPGGRARWSVELELRMNQEPLPFPGYRQ